MIQEIYEDDDFDKQWEKNLIKLGITKENEGPTHEMISRYATENNGVFNSKSRPLIDLLLQEGWFENEHYQTAKKFISMQRAAVKSVNFKSNAEREINWGKTCPITLFTLVLGNLAPRRAQVVSWACWPINPVAGYQKLSRNRGEIRPSFDSLKKMIDFQEEELLKCD